MSLAVQPLKTPLYRAGESFETWLLGALAARPPREREILAITSKVVSLAEGRRVAREGVDKYTLIQQEADQVLGALAYGSHLTITHGLLIPSAGIDESNSEGGHYLLLPEDPFTSARKLHGFLREKLGLREVGVIVTDSRTGPLRKGVTGVALAHWGFRGCDNRIGQSDLFGRDLKMTQINTADALAAAAVLLMGEGDERQPLAIVSFDQAEFVDQIDPRELLVTLSDDLYRPFFDSDTD